MLMPISLFGQAVNGNGKEGSAFPMPEQTGAAASHLRAEAPAGKQRACKWRHPYGEVRRT